MKYGYSAIALCVLLASLALAQSTSRFPKGITGLAESQSKAPSGQWLLDAENNSERFRRVQIYAGGTDQQMWQIGHRYQQVHQAITDENWGLAEYHWRKLRDVLNVALMKRPNRTPNAEAMFLDNSWQQLYDAIEAEDAERARATFLQQRGACMACHIAEDMPFLNDTPIFRDTDRFAEVEQP